MPYRRTRFRRPDPMATLTVTVALATAVTLMLPYI